MFRNKKAFFDKAESYKLHLELNLGKKVIIAFKYSDFFIIIII